MSRKLGDSAGTRSRYLRRPADHDAPEIEAERGYHEKTPVEAHGVRS
jgi:hypothetical protein